MPVVRCGRRLLVQLRVFFGQSRGWPPGRRALALVWCVVVRGLEQVGSDEAVGLELSKEGICPRTRGYQSTQIMRVS